MAHSIEARVPMLDHRVVEFAFMLPDDLKIRGVETKHVLREAMRGTLPESVRARTDKIGFRAEPTATWDLAERHRDSLLANRTPYEERWFDPEALAARAGRHEPLDRVRVLGLARAQREALAAPALGRLGPPA